MRFHATLGALALAFGLTVGGSNQGVTVFVVSSYINPGNLPHHVHIKGN